MNMINLINFRIVLKIIIEFLFNKYLIKLILNNFEI